MSRSLHLTSLVALLAASLTVAAPALAQDASATTQVRHGDDDEDVIVQGTSTETVFAAGRNVEIEARAADAFALGEVVHLQGEVLDNFLGAGQHVTVDGPVGGDAFLAGADVVLGADVAGDVYAGGESLTVPEDVTIGGNLYFGAGRLDLEGAVGGSVIGGGGYVELDGAVGGDVRVHAGDLVVGDDAAVGGSLSYESPSPAEVSDLATVAGTVDWTEKVESLDEEEQFGDGVATHLVWRLFLFLGALLSGTLLITVFPRLVTRPADVVAQEAPASLGLGFAALLGVPVLAIFLAMFIVPIPLSLMAMAVWVPATLLARYVAAYAVGRLVLERMGRATGSVGTMLAGLALLHLAYAVPVLGGLISLVATVVGLGALFLVARRSGAPLDRPIAA